MSLSGNGGDMYQPLGTRKEMQARRLITLSVLGKIEGYQQGINECANMLISIINTWMATISLIS